MKRCLSLGLFFIALFSSCENDQGPDVSNINVDLQTLRFEKDFFAMDTAHLSASLDAVYKRYPVFFRDYTQQILGLPPTNDSEEQALAAVRQFLRDYRPVYDSVMKVFPDLEKEEKEVVRG